YRRSAHSLKADRREPKADSRKPEADSCLLPASSDLLEHEPAAEGDAPLAAGDAGDPSERVAGRGAEAGARVAPAHRVRHVERIHPELGVLRAADHEPLEQRAVELPEARALRARVAAHVALRAGRRLRVGRRIEVGLGGARAPAADDLRRT